MPGSHPLTHLREASRISGARYQRVATYSVSAGLGWSSRSWHRERARPKSHSFTQHSASSSTLEGCVEHSRINQPFTLWIADDYYQGSFTSLILLYFFILFLWRKARTGGGIHPGEKAPGRSQTPFQCLKGCQESLGGTLNTGQDSTSRNGFLLPDGIWGKSWVWYLEIQVV